MSSNYPPGTGPNDPKAPWNQKGPVLIECPDCQGEAFVDHNCGEDTCCCLNPEPNVPCSTCDGEGHVEFDEDDEPEWGEE